jgi:hypothetical protein
MAETRMRLGSREPTSLGGAPVLSTRRGSYIVLGMICAPGQLWRVARKEGLLYA